MDGDSNVIVTDGFTGNVALKTAEGTAKFITSNLKTALKKNCPWQWLCLECPLFSAFRPESSQLDRIKSP